MDSPDHEIELFLSHTSPVLPLLFSFFICFAVSVSRFSLLLICFEITEEARAELQEIPRLRPVTGKKDKDRDRLRDSSYRNKKKRGSRREESEQIIEHTVENERDYRIDDAGALLVISPHTASSASDQSHQRMLLPARPVRPTLPPWKPTDEMIGVTVPRKARSGASLKQALFCLPFPFSTYFCSLPDSYYFFWFLFFPLPVRFFLLAASAKRLHDSWASTNGGGAAEQNSRQRSNSSGRQSVGAASPSSSDESVRKKMVCTCCFFFGINLICLKRLQD